MTAAGPGYGRGVGGLFICNLPNDHDNQVFVKSIVDVARGMKKITVAKFFQDAETLVMLKAFGVVMAQGYHLDMPRAISPGPRYLSSCTALVSHTAHV